MIGRVTIPNFRCFVDLDVSLRPLTVAIGPNDTGKSTFLDALVLAAPNGHYQGGSSESFQGKGPNVSIRTHSRHGRVLRADLPVAGPPMQSVAVRDVGSSPSMDAGVPAVLDWMLRKHRARYDELVDAVRASVPGVRDIEIAVPDPTSRRLDLVGEGGWTRPADQGSAGVKLRLYFLVLAWHPSPPEVVLIEEPETGLHPKRLQEVVALLRGLTEGRHTPQPVQVVLTTHSPYLLDFVDPGKDQVLVFRREPDGRCTASPLNAERIGAFLQDFGLGEIWSNEGEAGLQAFDEDVRREIRAG